MAADKRRSSSRGNTRPSRIQDRVQPSREIVFEVLFKVSESDAYANLLLPVLISRANLSETDARFTTELCYGTLRMQGSYDAIIEHLSGRPAQSLDLAVLISLRMGIHQILGMRVADHAAVNESVALVRRHKVASASGFVNAILRKVAGHDFAAWLEILGQQKLAWEERLAVQFSHPAWIVRALNRSLEIEGAADDLTDLLSADNQAPKVNMVTLPGLSQRPDNAEANAFSPFGFVLEGGDPAFLVGDSAGRIRVQDEGSQLAALALVEAKEIEPGERWLDLCAGPGGKSALLAASAKLSGAAFVANEVNPARAKLVRNALEPLGDIQVFEEDGRDFGRDHLGEFDRVMVDAPCSGLGALRRRPEARWRKSAADLASLTQLQLELFTAGFAALKPGGVLAYVTCSPHVAETRGVVKEAERALGDSLVPLDAAAVVSSLSATAINLGDQSALTGVQLWPHRNKTDAMFISLFTKA